MTRISRRIRRFVLPVGIASFALFQYMSSHGLTERYEFASATILWMCVAFLLGSRMRVSWFTVLVVIGIMLFQLFTMADAHSFLRYVLSVPWPVALFWALVFFIGAYLGNMYCDHEAGGRSGSAP